MSNIVEFRARERVAEARSLADERWAPGAALLVIGLSSLALWAIIWIGICALWR